MLHRDGSLPEAKLAVRSRKKPVEIPRRPFYRTKSAHFDAELVRLFSLLAPKASLALATEPLRAMSALAAARLLPAIGANDVTRHDAAQSVRAGFRDRELSAPWLAANGIV
ncbi:MULTISPECIES: hypothetical protein [unclassified Mesorhizobium]|uniref:hypothetical protein n=1 Tax=unclassified Mesorhizobium TaxID=325217 RepID=UPI001FDEC108|nr:MULTISPECIES: hypothetical protein [unclassified Mesorhizobium]